MTDDTVPQKGEWLGPFILGFLVSAAVVLLTVPLLFKFLGPAALSPYDGGNPVMQAISQSESDNISPCEHFGYGHLKQMVLVAGERATVTWVCDNGKSVSVKQ